MKNGIFTISLDFELFWGVRDNPNIVSYKKNILEVRNIVPKLLNLFDEFEVHVTWATVGFLFCENNEELNANLPKLKPTYDNIHFSPYNYIKESSVLDPNYHFGPNLIKKIKTFPYQEIGSHSYSHYYCQEPGQTINQFEDDVKAAVYIAKKSDIKLKSYVFARNQLNPQYLKVLKKYGFTSYRGNESKWFYNKNKKSNNTIIARMFRGIDHYINVTGHNTYSLKECKNGKDLYKIPSSQFLRINNGNFAILNELKLKRVKNSMKYAAINDRLFHLWWHPHNFGNDIEYNMDFLRKILSYYNVLKDKYNFQSLNMGEISKKINIIA
tara:strand:+ start:582 stop:1559 length:978 start_codon:yes stop_codon:yes gene_type:complete